MYKILSTIIGWENTVMTEVKENWYLWLPVSTMMMLNTYEDNKHIHPYITVNSH